VEGLVVFPGDCLERRLLARLRIAAISPRSLESNKDRKEKDHRTILEENKAAARRLCS
jgi:hypothetical protein